MFFICAAFELFFAMVCVCWVFLFFCLFFNDITACLVVSLIVLFIRGIVYLIFYCFVQLCDLLFVIRLYWGFIWCFFGGVFYC